MNHFTNAGTLLGLIHQRLPNCTLTAKPNSDAIRIDAETGTNTHRWTYSQAYTTSELDLSRIPLIRLADHFVRNFQQHCKYQGTT